ncbi:hypothetical protein KIPB_001684, partial [Kipferlia bialata]|eukprot:g1684.t1
MAKGSKSGGMSPMVLNIVSAVLWLAMVVVFFVTHGFTMGGYTLMSPYHYPILYTIIFLGLGAMVVMMFMNPPKDKQRLYDCFWVSCILSVAANLVMEKFWYWIYCPLCLLLCACVFYMYMQVGRTHWLIQGPTAVYLGWTLVVAVESLVLLFQGKIFKWTNPGEHQWFYILFLVILIAASGYIGLHFKSHLEPIPVVVAIL